MKEAGVRLKKPPLKPNELPLSGKEFVLTGKLESLSRPEAEARIKELGGAAKDNVTRKTDYVVYGADPGSKLARARELGIKTIEEKEFLKLIGKDVNMKLIVGLGNPGFLTPATAITSALCASATWPRCRTSASIESRGRPAPASATSPATGSVLARPQTYMNASGESVSALMQKAQHRPVRPHRHP